jgi:hypothetical protein
VEQLAANLANAEERCTSYSDKIAGLEEKLGEFQEDLIQVSLLFTVNSLPITVPDVCAGLGIGIRIRFRL